MIIETGLPYWTIVRRFNQHRSNPAIGGAAVRDMKKLEVTSPAINKRVVAFVKNNSPRVFPTYTGPSAG